MYLIFCFILFFLTFRADVTDLGEEDHRGMRTVFSHHIIGLLTVEYEL